MRNKPIKVFILVASIYLSGCAASGPRFSQIDNPPAELSQIYIYRPWAFTAGGMGLPVIHNGEQLPHVLHNQGYLNYLAQAGHHKMYVNVEGFVDRVFEFDTIPGETYFIKLSIQNYFMVMGTKLTLIDKVMALKEIKKCKLSSTGNSLTAAIQENAPTMGMVAKVTLPYQQKTDEQKNFIADEIRKLSELKNDGIITEEEFKNKKIQLLGALDKPN